MLTITGTDSNGVNSTLPVIAISFGKPNVLLTTFKDLEKAEIGFIPGNLSRPFFSDARKWSSREYPTSRIVI